MELSCLAAAGVLELPRRRPRAVRNAVPVFKEVAKLAPWIALTVGNQADKGRRTIEDCSELGWTAGFFDHLAKPGYGLFVCLDFFVRHGQKLTGDLRFVNTVRESIVSGSVSV